ncbi:DNA-damage-inducible protein F [Vibrio ruber DSM 16370]|uniref:DNA-damage-inducible protein F n=1 Tax=Vibrio ruber (strain DSM 16370 / JCM 11486 / BCRC 17186 / CECT 7878 / LMG 23124 / VR1) TaxID=1123498 RepID=A0A1R4LGE7_VIBR1|nr:MATE family efflux transporter [Vibrio ruber]SJN55638.1 DNA-damage-inducible protein F [Vibrio ruber DSM 16370]
MTTSLTHKDYLKIAIPFVISTLTQPLLGAVDTAVIGQLGSAALIGGVAVGTVIMNTLYWLFGFFRVSTTGQSAIALGKKSEQAKATSLLHPFVMAAAVGMIFIVSQSLIWRGAEWVIQPEPDVAAQTRQYFFILIWGAPFVLLNYTLIGWLMGQAKVKETLLTQIFGNVLNIVLDILFVVGLNMGVAGVAIATLTAQVATFLIGIYLVRRAAGFSFAPYLGLAKMGGQELKTIVSANTDLMLRTICLLAMFNCMARFGSSLGAETLAANAVMMQMTFLMSYMFEGVANASSVFSGKSVGERSLNLFTQVLKMNFQWTSGLIALLTVLMVLTHHQQVLLFTQIPDVVTQYHQVSGWLVVFPLVAGFGLTVYGIFTGSGTTRPVRNSTFLALLVFLLAIYFTMDAWGNQGLWLAFTLFYIGRFAFLYPYIGRVRQRCLAS